MWGDPGTVTFPLLRLIITFVEIETSIWWDSSLNCYIEVFSFFVTLKNVHI